MRIITILLLAFTLLASAESYSQGITMKGQNMPVQRIFNTIKEQTGFSFWYDYELVRNARPVTLNVKNATIEQVLDQVVKNQNFTYAIEDKVIVIRKTEKQSAPVNTNNDSPALTGITISGRVTNDAGEPLPGAVVMLKNSAKKTMADERGYFKMDLQSSEVPGAVLIVSYVGYYRVDYKVSGNNNIAVVLEKNVQQLQGVVVNSYSKPRKREELTGSVSTVTAQELQTYRPIESVDKMLEGLVPGMQVQTNTELGTPVKINIRGQNALTNLFSSNQTQLTTSSQPLFIIDGVPVTEQRRGDEPIAFLNNEELLNPLAGINPADIESVSVLKDAAAAAIYGANASNGVVIITTKRGKAGKTKIDVGYSYGWSQPINEMKWVTGPQYHELVKELYLNQGRDPFTAEMLAGPSDINTPWFKLTNRYGQYHNVDLNLSGGNENTQFRMSAGYQQQESPQKGNDYQKLSFRLRLDHNIGKKLHLSTSIAPTIIRKNALNVYSNVPIIPNVPAYNADGTFYELSNLGVPNPLAVLAQNVDYHSGGTINGNIRLDYQMTPQLTFSSSIGIDGLLNKQNIFESGQNATGRTKRGSAEIYDRVNFSWVNYNQVNWAPVLGKQHKLDLLAGFEAQSQSTKLLRGQGSGFTYYRLNELSNAENQLSASSRQVSNSYSVYGQAAYTLKSRYTATLAGRYDAASIFGPDINSTVNAAGGLGWTISKENFLSGIRFIDLLHLRGSYGTTGNSRIGSYQAKGIYSFSNTGYNGITSSSPSTAPNAALSWEKSYKLDIGFDFNFLRRFSFTFDFYQSILDDAISTIQVPVENGFSTVLANVGKMRNRGVDLGFQAKIGNRNFRWTSKLTAGFNKNVVVSVRNDSYRYSMSTTASVLRAGVSTSAIWGFRNAGVDPATGVPLYYDMSGKPTPINLLDRSMDKAYYLGDRLPDVQGGFINRFSYKTITVDINIIYSLGGKDLINYNLEGNGNNLNNRNQSVNMLDRWRKPGDITRIPKLTTGIPVVNSTQYLYDATFIKLSNVSVSYSLPPKIAAKLKGVQATVFLNATNLAYWYKDKSPVDRNGYREYRFNGFPESQTITWGARIGL